ncbi:MAG: hypothetical protein H8D72_00165, partial [Planctomycetes bacterium]|nr:hypothetical protein [Planctomycetota bacterium]
LRLGVIPTVAPYLLPTVVPAVHEVYPDLRLYLREGRTHELVDLCETGELDMLLLALDVELGSLASHHLFDDPFLLATPLGHPLAKRKRARKQDLADVHMLLLEEDHCLRGHALEFCPSSKPVLDDDFRASSLGTLMQMVAGGLGITLLPSIAARAEASPALELRPFQKAKGQRLPSRRIGLAWRPTSPRAKQFEELAGLFRDVLEPLAKTSS